MIYYFQFIDHSCTDVTISGTQPLSDFAMDGQPADWPYKSNQMQHYGAEAGTWKDNFLVDVPENFKTDFKTLSC